MATSVQSARVRSRIDPLEYLPHRKVTTFRRGQVIFNDQKPASGIYLVVRGKIMLRYHVDSGAWVLSDFCSTDEFFGESGLLPVPSNRECAIAMEDSSLMFWSGAEILDLVQTSPRLGVALIQVVLERNLRDQERLESLLLEKSPERIVRTLLYFADRVGTAEGAAVRVPPLSHRTIAGYIAASREIVTIQMNSLKQSGHIRYSRKGIVVNSDALRALLPPRSISE